MYKIDYNSYRSVASFGHRVLSGAALHGAKLCRLGEVVDRKIGQRALSGAGSERGHLSGRRL